MGTRSPLDRSAAHEALLYTSPEFPHADLDRGSQIITEFLEDFYRSSSANMYEFATTWRPYLCALCGKASANAVQCSECHADGQGPPPVSPPDVSASRRGGHARATARDGKMGVRRG